MLRASVCLRGALPPLSCTAAAAARPTPWKTIRKPAAASSAIRSTITGATVGSCIPSHLLEPMRSHGDEGNRAKPLKVYITLPNGTEKEVVAYEGQTLLDVCAEHKLPMEGACAGSCACSTCHVYLEDDAMDLFTEPSDAENDMIDLAFFPEPTSRLGCQLHLEQAKHNGLKVTMPKATRNMYVDGATPVPH